MASNLCNYFLLYLICDRGAFWHGPEAEEVGRDHVIG